MICPKCACVDVKTEVKKYEFPYGVEMPERRGGVYEFKTATIPIAVRTCQCGFSWTDDEADAAITKRIRELREELATDMPQAMGR